MWKIAESRCLNHCIATSLLANSPWSGPLTDFAFDAASLGYFTINMTSPPKWLQPKSQEHLLGSSNFDLFVYATAFGYLDFCISSYTITDKGSSITTMFEMKNDPIST
jgi:hypothetical protein